MLSVTVNNISLLCKFWQSNDLFADVSWEIEENPNACSVSIAEGNTAVVRYILFFMNIWHQIYLSSQLSSASCVNIYPQFPASLLVFDNKLL